VQQINNSQGPGKAADLLGHLLRRAQYGQCNPLQNLAHRVAGNALLGLFPDRRFGVEVG